MGARGASGQQQSMSALDWQLRAKEEEIRKRQRLLPKEKPLSKRDWGLWRFVGALSNGSTTTSVLSVAVRLREKRVQADDVVQRLSQWRDKIALSEQNKWTAAPVGRAAQRMLGEARKFMLKTEGTI